MMLFLLSTLFVTGLAVGSFLNVLIDRLSNEETLMGRSYCDHCRRQLQWYDMFPVLSYVFYGGKSACCGKRLSLYYPFVETLTGVVFVASWIYFVGYTAVFDYNQLVVYAGWLGILCAIIVILCADVKYRIIPDEMTIAIVVFSLFLPSVRAHLVYHFMAGIGLFLLLYGLYLITKRKGIGFGDVKLAFAVGFLFGMTQALLSLYIAFLSGGIVSMVLLILRKKGLKSTIAFGPFMIFGMLLMIFFGDIIEIFFWSLF